MPANFPEIWERRVIQNLDNSDKPTWLGGMTELSASVSVINPGAESEKNVIHVAETDFEVDVLINNNSYPLDVQQYEDGTLSFTLDKYNTKVVTLTDDQIIGASYEKIDVVTKSSTRAITVKKYKKAIHSIGPQQNTPKTPVLSVTGGEDGLTAPGGRKRLTYEDLVAFKEACDQAGFGDDVRLVLCTSHWNDLLLDRKTFGNQLVDYAKGKPSPNIAGFELHKYEKLPTYTSAGVKKPFGAASAAGDKVSSVAFVPERIAKKTGLTKQYFADAKTNPKGQTNDLAYRHYFVAVPFQNNKIGALIS